MARKRGPRKGKKPRRKKFKRKIPLKEKRKKGPPPAPPEEIEEIPTEPIFPRPWERPRPGRGYTFVEVPGKSFLWEALTEEDWEGVHDDTRAQFDLVKIVLMKIRDGETGLVFWIDVSRAEEAERMGLIFTGERVSWIHTLRRIRASTFAFYYRLVVEIYEMGKRPGDFMLIDQLFFEAGFTLLRPYWRSVLYEEGKNHLYATIRHIIQTMRKKYGGTPAFFVIYLTLWSVEQTYPKRIAVSRLRQMRRKGLL